MSDFCATLFSIFPLPVKSHIKVLAAGSPFFMLLHQYRSQQTYGRGRVGENPDHALAAADLRVQPLEPVGRA